MSVLKLSTVKYYKINDPQMAKYFMISKMDRKRSCEKLRNGMDLSWIFDEWGHLQRNLRGNKENFFFLPASTGEGKEEARSQVN